MKFKNFYNHAASKGFTLIELSIVIIIVGILVLPLMQLFTNYEKEKRVQITKDNINKAFSLINGWGEPRYPCPTDRSLAKNSPNYGIEQCDITTIPLCTAPGLQGICRFQTAIDRDTPPDGVGDFIVIGGIPSQTYDYNTITGVPDLASLKPIVGARPSEFIDGWYNQLTYAVSEKLMLPTKTSTNIDFKLGVISVQNENGQPTSGVNNDGQFVVLSHGRNGSGAFTTDSVSLGCPAGSMETENCNEDSTFVSALGHYEGTVAQYYDDYIKAYSKSSGDLWVNLTVLGARSAHINNINIDNVGVNITTGEPKFKLDVDGILSADTIRANRICGPPTVIPLCFNTNLFDSVTTTSPLPPIATPGVCNDGQVVTEMSASTLKCNYPSYQTENPAPVASRACAAGFFVTEIYTNGCFRCSNGDELCL